MKPDPFTVSVKFPPSAITRAGEMLDIEGAGLLTVNVTDVEVPPPGEGVKTVIDNRAPVAASDAGMAALSWVLLTNVVVRVEPLTCTTEPLTKLPPLTVSVNAPLPAVVLLGEMFDKDGAGLTTASVNGDDVPPPGAALLTVMERFPGDATSLAGMDAVSWVELTNVVVRADPLTCTSDPLTKLLPLTVSVNPARPADTLAGEMLDMEGAGLLTASESADEVPPPGAALLTVMERLPADATSLAGMVAVS